MQLEGKVAVITGGSRGIGFAIAQAFVREGARVVFNGRNADRGEAALRALGAGARAHFVEGDVTKPEDCDRVIDAAMARFDRLDILVNNAGGVNGMAPVIELGDEDWMHMFAWHVHSTFYCTRRALRYMLPQSHGRVINISSLQGKEGAPGLAHYTAAKHAVNGFTKAVAREVGPRGITVNAVCTGLVLTEVLQEVGGPTAAALGLEGTLDALIEKYSASAALRRPVTVEEVAALVLLLASDAGSGISGALLSVDGGTAYS